MKFVSFRVDNINSSYCINLDNINCFVDKSQINIHYEKNNENYVGITSFRDKVLNVLNTKKVFNIDEDLNEDYNKFIIMNLDEKSIIIPVYKIIGIFESNDLKEIKTNTNKFNYVIKNGDDLNVLIEEDFFKN